MAAGLHRGTPQQMLTPFIFLLRLTHLHIQLCHLIQNSLNNIVVDAVALDHRRLIDHLEPFPEYHDENLQYPIPIYYSSLLLCFL